MMIIFVIHISRRRRTLFMSTRQVGIDGHDGRVNESGSRAWPYRIHFNLVGFHFIVCSYKRMSRWAGGRDRGAQRYGFQQRVFVLSLSRPVFLSHQHHYSHHVHDSLFFITWHSSLCFQSAFLQGFLFFIWSQRCIHGWGYGLRSRYWSKYWSRYYIGVCVIVFGF